MTEQKFVTDTQTKANIFNKFFAEQCTPLSNGGVLPVNQMFFTQARLRSLDFKEVEILKIIRALNINKAHGYDDISIGVIKICDKLLLKPLILSFKIHLNHLVTQTFGKDLILFLRAKEVINNKFITTDQSLFCPFVV